MLLKKSWESVIFESCIFENIFYSLHSYLYCNSVLNSWSLMFWRFCSSVSTGSIPVQSKDFSFLFLEVLKNFSLSQSCECSSMRLPVGAFHPFCWVLAERFPSESSWLSIFSVFLDFSPISCSHCLEYNSNVRLCILESISVSEFLKIVLFSYTLCNICFLTKNCCIFSTCRSSIFLHNCVVSDGCCYCLE